MQTVNQKLIPLTKITEFIRPSFKISPNFFFSEGREYTFNLIDPYIYNSLRSLKSGYFEDSERKYQHFHTGSIALSYEQFFCFLKKEKNIDDFYSFLKEGNLISNINELITTAGYLVQEDIIGKGILRNLFPENQEYLNLGYFALGYEIFAAFLERKQILSGKQREYHLHYNLPPIYQPFSNLLMKV